MSVSYDAIENAFLFVCMGQECLHNAYLCKKTGEIFYTSAMGDSDELPEDIDDSEAYISIPRQSELHLGKELVSEYVSKHFPHERDRVEAFFTKRGAYSRFKDLLRKRGYLDTWYEFEEERRKNALKQWCAQHDIELDH